MLHDGKLKDELAASRAFSKWVGSIVNLDKAHRKISETAIYTGAELRKRQIAAGYSIEELEMILHPMAEDAKETLASMGDDTPSAVLS